MARSDPDPKSSQDAARGPEAGSEEEFEELLAHALGLVMEGRQAELESWLAEQGAWRERIEADLSELAAVGLIGMGGSPERSIGDYKVLETLGRGGMGHVYLALDERLGRKVALKVLRDMGELGAAGSQRVERFHREAKVVASLHHPNLVTLLNSGESGGVPWLAFEYVEGLTWEAAIEALATDARRDMLSGPRMGRLVVDDSHGDELPERFAGSYVQGCMALGLDVARALEAAHRRGVLHRDVKPSNILIDRLGNARLFDFGLASASDELALTRSTTSIGSRRTMPPEQWNRPTHELDVRADVYSLGVTLYHAIALRPPFEQVDEVSLRRAIEAGRVTRLAALGFSRDLDAVIGHAMEADRELRYPDISAFAADLDRVIKGQPPLARPAGRARRSLSWARRNPIHATAWCLGFLLLTVVPTLFAIQEFKNSQVLDDLLAEQTELRIQADEAASLSNEAFHALSSSIARWTPVDGAIRDRVNSALKQAGELLERARGVEPATRARMLVSIAQAEISFEYYDDAEVHLRRALDLGIERLEDEGALAANCHRLLSMICHGQERYADADLHYRAALQGYWELPAGEFEPELWYAIRSSFADMYAQQGFPELGAAIIQGAYGLQDDPRVTWTPAERIEFMRQLARRYIGFGDYEDAVELCDEALDLGGQILPANDVMFPLVREMRMRATLHIDPLSADPPRMAELRRTLETSLGVRHAETLFAVALQARALWNLGRGVEAAEVLNDFRAKLGLPDKSISVQFLLLECYASFFLSDFERLEQQVELLAPRIAADDWAGLEKVVHEFDLFRAATLDAKPRPDPVELSRMEERLGQITISYAPVDHLVVLSRRYLARFAARRGDLAAAEMYYDQALAVIERAPSWLEFYRADLDADLAAIRAGERPAAVAFRSFVEPELSGGEGAQR